MHRCIFSNVLQGRLSLSLHPKCTSCIQYITGATPIETPMNSTWQTLILWLISAILAFVLFCNWQASHGSEICLHRVQTWCVPMQVIILICLNVFLLVWLRLIRPAGDRTELIMTMIGCLSTLGIYICGLILLANPDASDGFRCVLWHQHECVCIVVHRSLITGCDILKHPLLAASNPAAAPL